MPSRSARTPANVMLDARHLGAAESGIGRYTRALVTALHEQRPELGFRLVVRRAGDERGLEAALAPGGGAAVLPFAPWPYGLRSTLLLPARLGPRPAELFHSVYHVLPRGLACPSVMTIHDLIPFEGRQGSRFPFPIWCAEYAYFRLAIPESLRRTTRIIAVSAATADALVARFPWCRPKVRVVHHGVDARFAPCRDAARAERRAAELTGGASPFALLIGGLSRNKNQLGMLRAFAAARRAERAVRLVVVARYGDARRLERAAAELGVHGALVLLPHVADDDLRTLLHAARFFAFCSRIEGFGLPLLEAMACGCPTLTSNRSAMAEVVGDAALLADPDDVGAMARQMSRLFRDAGLCAELAAQGVARARSFTWARTALLTGAVYDEAVA